MGRVPVKFVLLVLFLEANAAKCNRREPCRSYGCPYRPHYESFVPAPRGHTPRCAKPGQTFCESLADYPQQLIKFLVDNGSYDFATILRDEAQCVFNSYTSKPEYRPGYDYPRQEVPQFYPQASLPQLPQVPQYSLPGQPGIVYTAPFNDTDHEGYNYTPPARAQRNPFLINAPPQAVLTSQHKFHSVSESTPWTQNQEQGWWSNRFARRSDTPNVPLRSRRENPLLKYTNTNRIRNKRQGDPEKISLCQTDSDYIMPRAALNNQGDWMYVVNLSDTRRKYSQLVRVEICTTSVCNSLCSLPLGYTSRCEQQYVQKRLVALEETGERLHIDVFWFPHGCSCQITFNN